MSLTRRELLAGTAQLAAAAAFQPTAAALPARRDFAIPAGQTYLNGAFIHPMPIAAAARGDALHRVAHLQPRALERRRSGGQGPRAVRVADQRQARRDQPGREHQPRREPRRQRPRPRRPPGGRQRGHRRPALRGLAHSVRRAAEAGTRRAAGAAARLADRPCRHGTGRGSEDAAGRGLAGLLVQRLSARSEARVRVWRTPTAPTSTPTSSRRPATRRSTCGRAASTSAPARASSG